MALPNFQRGQRARNCYANDFVDNLRASGVNQPVVRISGHAHLLPRRGSEEPACF